MISTIPTFAYSLVRVPHKCGMAMAVPALYRLLRTWILKIKCLAVTLFTSATLAQTNSSYQFYCNNNFAMVCKLVFDDDW